MEIKSSKLAKKRIALCLTGSIAAVESVKLTRELRRHGGEVTVYMTRGAQDIIHPNALEFASGKTPITSLSGKLEHLTPFDLVIVAPATANTLSKIYHGIADNAVTSLVLSSSCVVLIAPAMHFEMYQNSVLRKNLEKLKSRYNFADPLIEEGSAKMASVNDIMENVFYALTPKDLEGKQVIVTAGPTAEPIDPVRFISNRSSGKMGIALAKEASKRGADVKLIYGSGSERPPTGIEVVRVRTASEMAKAVSEQKNYDLFISAAAVSDFTTKPKKEKISSRKGPIDLHLYQTPKVLSLIERDAIKVGFKAEHGVTKDELIFKAKDLVKEHDLDLVVANDVSKDVFGSDESEVYLVKKDTVTKLKRMEKTEIARRVLDYLVKI
jgi:phosphopantothenoylcysteine decarboxylase/phosphopantothenate--cysteine ligase